MLCDVRICVCVSAVAICVCGLEMSWVGNGRSFNYINIPNFIYDVFFLKHLGRRLTRATWEEKGHKNVFI